MLGTRIEGGLTLCLIYRALNHDFKSLSFDRRALAAAQRFRLLGTPQSPRGSVIFLFPRNASRKSATGGICSLEQLNA